MLFVRPPTHSSLSDYQTMMLDFAASSYKVSDAQRKERTQDWLDASWDNEKRVVHTYKQWNIDKSDPHWTVWVNKEKKVVVLSIRGTECTQTVGECVGDLNSDVFVAVGRVNLSARYNDAYKIFNQVLGKYSGYKIILVGHSLGGTICEAIFFRNQNAVYEAHTFNPGKGLGAITDAVVSSWNRLFRIFYHKLNEYYIAGDPVSTLGSAVHDRNIIILPPKTAYAHGLHNFK